MDEINQNLTRRIMRRVYVIWFFRQIIPGLFVIPLALVASLWLIAKEFFVTRIVENFTTTLQAPDMLAGVKFVATGLLYNTHYLPVLIIGGLVGLSLFMAYRVVRNFTRISLVRV